LTRSGGLVGALVSHLVVKVRSWQDLVAQTLVAAAITWGLDQAF